MPEPIPYRELDIIGYADVPGGRIHPRILPPVFRVRGTERVLFPPYSLLHDSVAGAVESNREEFADRVADGRQITELPGTLPALEGHHLWINDQNGVHYGPRLEVQKAFDDLFSRHLAAAEEALAQNPPALDAAYSHAAVAHAIRPEHIEPFVIRGVVEWERGDSDSLDYTEELAQEQMTLPNFRRLVRMRREPLAGIISALEAPLNDPALLKALLTDPALLRALLNDPLMECEQTGSSFRALLPECGKAEVEARSILPAAEEILRPTAVKTQAPGELLALLEEAAGAEESLRGPLAAFNALILNLREKVEEETERVRRRAKEAEDLARQEAESKQARAKIVSLEKYARQSLGETKEKVAKITARKKDAPPAEVVRSLTGAESSISKISALLELPDDKTTLVQKAAGLERESWNEILKINEWLWKLESKLPARWLAPAAGIMCFFAGGAGFPSNPKDTSAALAALSQTPETAEGYEAWKARSAALAAIEAKEADTRAEILTWENTAQMRGDIGKAILKAVAELAVEQKVLEVIGGVEGSDAIKQFEEAKENLLQIKSEYEKREADDLKEKDFRGRLQWLKAIRAELEKYQKSFVKYKEFKTEIEAGVAPLKE